MPGGIIIGRGGTCEEKLPFVLRVIDCMAHLIPDSWDNLPLINEPRPCAFKPQCWLHARKVCLWGVSVELDNRLGKLACRGSFSTRAGAFKKEGTRNTEPSFDFCINDSGQVHTKYLSPESG